MRTQLVVCVRPRSYVHVIHDIADNHPNGFELSIARQTRKEVKCLREKQKPQPHSFSSNSMREITTKICLNMRITFASTQNKKHSASRFQHFSNYKCLLLSALGCFVHYDYFMRNSFVWHYSFSPSIHRSLNVRVIVCLFSLFCRVSFFRSFVLSFFCSFFFFFFFIRFHSRLLSVFTRIFVRKINHRRQCEF